MIFTDTVPNRLRPVGLANAFLSSEGFPLLDRFGMTFYLTDEIFSMGWKLYYNKIAQVSKCFPPIYPAESKSCRSERFRPKRLSARRNPVRSLPFARSPSLHSHRGLSSRFGDDTAK